jgi:hypothetical protein
LRNRGARYSLNLALIALDDGEMSSIEKSLDSIATNSGSTSAENMSKVD